jgi:hypothetical protein
MTDNKPSAHSGQPWRRAAAGLPALGAGLAPAGVCPICITTITGIASSLGFGFLLETAYLFPLMAGLLGLTLFSLGRRARMRHGFGPLIVGTLAAGVLLTGKFILPSGFLLYGGLAVLVGTTLWNAWPSKRRAACQTG